MELGEKTEGLSVSLTRTWGDSFGSTVSMQVRVARCRGEFRFVGRIWGDRLSLWEVHGLYG